MMKADHPTIVAALQFLIPIAEKYCSGELAKDELKSERDAKLKEMKGIAKKTSKATEKAERETGEDGGGQEASDGGEKTGKKKPAAVAKAAAVEAGSTPMASSSSSSKPAKKQVVVQNSLLKFRGHLSPSQEVGPFAG